MATGPAAPESPGPESGPPVRAAREWVLLPPLTPVVRPVAPLVVGSAPVRPPLTTPRPAVTTETGIVGTVTGLARVLPPPQAFAPGPALPRPAPRRRVTAVPSAAEPAPLTAATDAYVGEAREPAEPHRAPGWMRYVPEWLQQQQSEPEPVAIPSNLPPSLRQPRPIEQAAPAPEQARPELIRPERVSEARAEPVERPAHPRRRPNLGQARRLGLGAPVSQSPAESAVPEPPPAGTRTGFPYTMDGLRRLDQPPVAPSLADALGALGQAPLLHTRAEPPPTPERASPEVARESRPPSTPAPEPAEPPPAPPRAADSVVVPDIVAVPVPADIAADVGRAGDVDVAAVPVYRGPAVDAAARARGARAFARADAVFLPDAAGPLTAPKARALVAHELVHVAQQRTRGRTPDPGTAEGRGMEAEASAVERRYETTAASRPALRHPPTPAAPEMSGPAQLAPVTPAVPDPVNSHFDPPAREEIVALAESSAHRVVEEWTHPALGGQPARAPAPSAGGGGFDRATRRRQLEAEMLDLINEDRAEQNLPTLGYLEPGDVERLERRLDREEVTGVRSSGVGGRTPPPPLAGGAFGDTVSFTQTIGGATPGGPQRPGARAPQTPAGSPVAAASRLGLAAALTGQAGGEAERLPAVEGGRLGDTVSFTERGGDDQYVGGRRPERSAEDSRADMHGSEQEPIDLDRVDLEELTARLYDRLRGRLRLELLVDRERAGLLTDFR
ncbi:eCIS core domain-containing protein [Actinokineospora sp. 24-640]